MKDSNCESCDLNELFFEQKSQNGEIFSLILTENPMEISIEVLSILLKRENN